VRCTNCGFVFANRRPTPDELVAHYEGYSRAECDSTITRARYEELLDEFAAFRRSGRILDMGCGVGSFLEVAAERGWEVFGTETTETALEICAAKGIAVKRAPLDPGAWPDGHFDVITSFEVVEHLTEPEKEAPLVAALLRPGGLFYCTTPNFDSLSRRVLRGGWTMVSYPEHLSYFTDRTLSRWLGRSGLKRASVASTGVSVSRLRPQPRASARQDDERVRETIEASPRLRLVKNGVNRALSALRLGDTLKGRFIRARPAAD
jgi:2-polyprenyl-3-methyl-5-hydroxy-6-metoxy-1,4-benzoquinol methylase